MQDAASSVVDRSALIPPVSEVHHAITQARTVGERVLQTHTLSAIYRSNTGPSVGSVLAWDGSDRVTPASFVQSRHQHRRAKDAPMVRPRT
ncbi:hypothetical protein HCN50_28595 [Bradyrhizobium sp. WSM 1744]|uniref:Uncharacterized protein n=1 Tax=Bradyrhizobium archetypum TaxID=2721160 RepID=A0A7Y4HBB9_9BRAD|nr:hypothetical protein [Bradyrhizobium archetypum]